MIKFNPFIQNFDYVGDTTDDSLTADVDYYISTTGSDIDGDGSVDNPFETIQHAIDILPKNLGGHQVYIYLLDGSYVQDTDIERFFSGNITITSFSGDATLVDITAGMGNAFSVLNCLTRITISNMRLTATSPNHLIFIGDSPSDINDIIFQDNGIVSPSRAIVCNEFSYIRVWNNIDGVNQVDEGITVEGGQVVADLDSFPIGTVPYTIIGGVLINSETGFIKAPTTAPTADYYVVNKKYIDETGGKVDGNIYFPSDSVPTERKVWVDDQIVTDTGGNDLSLYAGKGNGNGDGGNANLVAGTGGATGLGGNAVLQGGDSAITSGDAMLLGGSGTNNNTGGNSVIGSGSGNGTGNAGEVIIVTGNAGEYGAGSLITISGTNGGALAADGEGYGTSVTIGSCSATHGNNDGGDVNIGVGSGTGTGRDGFINLMGQTKINGNYILPSNVVADGTYTMGLGLTQNGTITISGGLITAIQECI